MGLATLLTGGGGVMAVRDGSGGRGSPHRGKHLGLCTRKKGNEVRLSPATPMRKSKNRGAPLI
jgi:hypothetical protein